MTVRELYEAALIEVDKTTAPNFLLSDFNYYCYKAIQQYVNKRYNLCELNQQLSDDLRALKITKEIPKQDLGDFELPENYLHCLNCICKFEFSESYNCNKLGSGFNVAARRLTSDIYSQAITNYYFKPSVKCPYYDIYIQDNKYYLKIVYETNLPVSLTKISIDYIKTPEKVELTEFQLDSVEDTSQTLEFPDYVCHEIINELVKLLLENSSNPRLESNLAINQTIASPVPQQSKK